MNSIIVQLSSTVGVPLLYLLRLPSCPFIFSQLNLNKQTRVAPALPPLPFFQWIMGVSTATAL